MANPAFDDRVAAYAASPSHRSGPSLDLAVELAAVRPGRSVLDVSTGTGFTAQALENMGCYVVVADVAPSMLRHTLATASKRLCGVLTDTQQLAFADGVFDAVTCRHAFHHYVDGMAAMQEMARVVCPGGRVVVADTIAPDDVEASVVMHAIETRRDSSHVRNRDRASLIDVFEAVGLRVERVESTTTVQVFESWCSRTDVDDVTREQLWELFTAKTSVREAFGAEERDEKRMFTWPVAVVAGTRRS